MKKMPTNLVTLPLQFVTNFFRWRPSKLNRIHAGPLFRWSLPTLGGSEICHSRTIIHACFAFSVFEIPQLDVNLTPEPSDSTTIIALFNKRILWSQTCLQINFQIVKTGLLLVHILATTTVGGAAISWAGGGRFDGVRC